MKNKNTGVNSTPQAWIAVSNNRQKIYGAKNDLVYLDAGQEFQIELYNPTSTSYLAKIYLNDKLISTSGLVIKPGQRYFLDRHIDEQRKLLFSTYSVDDNEEVKEVIKNNGKLKVEFYQENTPNWNSISTGTVTWTNPNYVTPPIVWATHNSYITNTGGLSGNLANLSGGATLNGINATYTTNSFVNPSFNNSSISSNTLETGRIERGGNSNQDFGKDYGNYSFYCAYKSEYQILPRSVKPVEVTELREYCTECGSRIKKKTWKFCPSCGESLG